MKIGVTTANGHLGSKIIQTIIRKRGSENLIGFARTPSKADFLGIEIRQGDYDQPQHFEEGLKDIDVLMLITGMDPPEKRLLQHQNMIDAAKKNKVRKIVFTSIIGDPNVSAFGSFVDSSRKTEEKLKKSGLDWIAGRNGLYIEPDLESVKDYASDGKIKNSAGKGKCSYCHRDELAEACYELLTRDEFNNNHYNLTGKTITQYQLSDIIREVFHANVSYEPISIEEYYKDRIEKYGEFYGNIIGGIYESIRKGVFDVKSDFEQICGRPHKSYQELAKAAS